MHVIISTSDYFPMPKINLRNLISQKIASGMTQYELADLVGISQASVQKYLNTNTVPNLATLKKFASTFSIPLSDFIGEGHDLGVVADPLTLEAIKLFGSLPPVLDALSGLMADFAMTRRVSIKNARGYQPEHPAHLAKDHDHPPSGSFCKSKGAARLSPGSILR